MICVKTNFPWYIGLLRFQIARISGMKNEVVTGQYFIQIQLNYNVRVISDENVGTPVMNTHNPQFGNHRLPN